jgi:hypothetical protein
MHMACRIAHEPVDTAWADSSGAGSSDHGMLRFSFDVDPIGGRLQILIFFLNPRLRSAPK